MANLKELISFHLLSNRDENPAKHLIIPYSNTHFQPKFTSKTYKPNSELCAIAVE